MARPIVVTPRGFSTPTQGIQENETAIVESRLNGGMNTYLDGADLQNYNVTFAQNVEIQADKIRRRPGSETLTATKPNSETILLYTAFKRFDGTIVYLRFTKTKLYKLSGASWVEITGASPFSVTDYNRVKFTTLNDRFFFVVGNKEIQEINFTANTYASLGNAGAYKYITGFFNRVVGANLYSVSTPNPTLMAWSGDINFTQWNPATDISAGTNPLLEAATDFADPITGLFGFASVMLILRERSLWTATKRPVASAPFAFQASFPYVGCDTPNSAIQKRNGLVWYDSKSNQVYDYTIGQTPTPIGNPIRNEIPSKIDNLDSITATYDQSNNRYHLLIPNTLSTQSYEFVYDFDTSSWVQNIRTNASTVSYIEGGIASLYISDLSGYIDGLGGVIDNLINSTINPSKLFYGLKTGDIVSTNASLTADSGTAFTSSIVSKIYTAGTNDLAVHRLSFKYKPLRTGTFTVSYSTDIGTTWNILTTETITTATLDTRKRVSCAKHIRATEFMWKIEMPTANIEILEYSLEAVVSPFTKSY
jgi:hypothetical protein